MGRNAFNISKSFSELDNLFSEIDDVFLSKT